MPIGTEGTVITSLKSRGKFHVAPVEARIFKNMGEFAKQMGAQQNKIKSKGDNVDLELAIDCRYS